MSVFFDKYIYGFAKRPLYFSIIISFHILTKSIARTQNIRIKSKCPFVLAAQKLLDSPSEMSICAAQ